MPKNRVLPSFFIILLSLHPLGWTQENRPLKFNEDIRPILAQHCFSCHGPDAKTRKANLRFDQPQSAKQKLKSGRWVIDSNNPHQSELLLRLKAEDPEDRMPPPEAPTQLNSEEIKKLELWISQGAPYQKHWAFEKIGRPQPPKIKGTHPAQNEIDAFIFKRQENQKIIPSSMATKRTLARRASLDLRGFPPSIEELENYLKDDSPQAWEHYLDHLLASKHYGERMAQDWLDLARYGDTNGYHADSDRTIWLYRDYVINSFNDNKPFDQFVRENLAGDLLPKATTETKIASGFNRCNTFNEEGGADPEEFYVAYAVDRANTTGQVFFGLTIGCAQCHDHKYDPISQKDYYQLVAFFNSVQGEIGAGGPSGYHGKELPPLLKVPGKDQERRLEEIQSERRTTQEKLTSLLSDDILTSSLFKEAFTLWQAQQSKRAPPTRPKSEGLVLWLDASDINGNGIADQKENFKPQNQIHQWNDLSGQKNHAKSPIPPTYIEKSIGGLPSISFDGKTQFLRTETGGDQLQNDFTLISIFKAENLRTHQMLVMWGEEDRGKRRALWILPDRSFSFNGYHADLIGKKKASMGGHLGSIQLKRQTNEVELLLDGEHSSQNKVPLKNYKNKKITLGCNNANKEFAKASISELLIFNRQLSVREQRNVGLYLSQKYGLKTKFHQSYPELITKILEIDKDRRSQKQVLELSRYFLKNNYLPLQEKKAQLEAQLKNLEAEERNIKNSFPSTLVMVEKPKRTPTYILMRGDFQQRGEEVEPGIPEIFGKMDPKEPKNRLGLARWITSDENPLLARVTVNRIWKQLFGTGLVKTAGDFGTQGELPSHPQLLDWLASELKRSNWNIKRLQKKILMSSTYQQSSFNSHRYDSVDPDNRLLWRAPRFRLSAESIRDSALSISGLLNPKVGGPSVKPYQPQGYYRDKVGRDWKTSQGPDLYRRGLYTYWRRTTLYPSFQIFDAPSREVCTVSRPRTNTPLQALVLMNDPGYVEAARVFAESILQKGGKTTEERLKFSYLKTVSRIPSQKELEVLGVIIKEQKAHFTKNPQAAKEWIQNGKSKPNSKLNEVELAAWTSLASVLLNLDETITRE